MNISKEERAELRAVAEDATVGKPNGAASFVEDFESNERHKLLEDVVSWQFEAKSMHAGDYQFFLYFSQAKCLELLDALESAEARAESAERERDYLAQTLVEECTTCPDGSSSYLCDNPVLDDRDCAHCWLEWARQQARGGENE